MVLGEGTNDVLVDWVVEGREAVEKGEVGWGEESSNVSLDYYMKSP